MGFEIRADGLTEISEALEKLAENAPKAAAQALYEGAGLMANEVALQCGDKTLRCDSIVYDKNAHPQMIIEYKAPTVQITQRVFNQISAYNLLLHVDYLVVSNGVQHYCCKMDYDSQSFHFEEEIPGYEPSPNPSLKGGEHHAQK